MSVSLLPLPASPELVKPAETGGGRRGSADATPSGIVQAASRVILGEVIDVRPGPQAERENTIPDGYEPHELLDDADGFTPDPEADEPPARTLPERSSRPSFVAVDVGMEDALTANAASGDVVTIQVMSGQPTADGGADLDFRGPALIAGGALPVSWADGEQLHLDWGEARTTPLSETCSPCMDGFWLGVPDGVIGLHGMDVCNRSGNPRIWTICS